MSSCLHWAVYAQVSEASCTSDGWDCVQAGASHAVTGRLSPEEVNRRLDFTPQLSKLQASCSSQVLLVDFWHGNAEQCHQRRQMQCMHGSCLSAASEPSISSCCACVQARAFLIPSTSCSLMYQAVEPSRQAVDQDCRRRWLPAWQQLRFSAQHSIFGEPLNT